MTITQREDRAMEPLHGTRGLAQAQRNYPNDKKRIRSRKEALLNFLSDGGWHPNYECARVGGISWHCSVYALRNEGWIIEPRPVKGGVWEYRLSGRSQHRLLAPKLSKPQRRVVDELLLGVRKAYGDAGIERLQEHLPPWLNDETKASYAVPNAGVEPSVAATVKAR
jgi:hypothetical protein